jgi:branched-chain amino acid transport system permease protein
VRRALPWTAAALAIALLAPRALDAGQLRLAAELLLAIGMVQMWNLLAGYTGLLSLGHQLFVATGAYVLFEATRRLGVSPLAMLPLAALGGGLLAALLAPLLFRLREAYFAVGMWVVAEIGWLLVSKSAMLGGPGGQALDLSAVQDLEAFGADAFRAAVAIGVGLPLVLAALLQSRLGLALLTVRDNELAARSIGVDVQRVRLLAFMVSGAGCALAGAAHYMGAMFVAPDAAFDINWVVMMLFATLIGGIGTQAGPVLGVLLWFALREATTGWWGWSGGSYLIAMGLLATALSLAAPEGLWCRFVSEPGERRRRARPRGVHGTGRQG